MPEKDERQCMDRWNLYLNPELNNNPWTPQEDMELLTLYSRIRYKKLIRKNKKSIFETLAPIVALQNDFISTPI